MFPLRDNIPARHFPVVNLWLIIVNILCFVYEFKLGSSLDSFIGAYGFIPARFMLQQSVNLLDLSRFVPVFSSMFLHAGILHLVSNMWMLWIFGDNVEDIMGQGRYLVFYVVCGVVAVFLQAWIYPLSTTPMVGASGAISGVLGAYVLNFPRAKILTFIPVFIFFYLVEVSALFFLVFWFLMQFLQGTFHLMAVGRLVEGGVAWWAHIGGFTAGLILVPFFRHKKKKKKKKRIEL